ncbi:adenosylcobinamide-GDP ribazoletransferase [Paenibacillus harenae]|uniref:adenosylcobinamide-GDP ribazoletransferase n=1 Tax=Paenibacillus harenae TaxID=306543 RepID=UPI000417095B|nr:adenosylcobinamide-GDP ribazoletransferase [Paenibacillus harenae]
MVRRTVRLHLQALIAAFQFLTRAPIPVTVPFESPVLTRSVIYFPLAGAFIGACVAAAGWLLQLAVPAWPAAVLLLALWTALSGGLHLDGWMDTADGVLSHRSRERMLEIMKDSRVGAMGVLAAVLLLLFKAALLAELLGGEKPGTGLILLLLCPIWSRAWMSASIAIWPSARSGEGIGTLFNGVKLSQAAAAFVVSVVLTGVGLRLAGIDDRHILQVLLVAFVLTVLSGGLLALWLNRKLGGLTGDTYGAMNEAVEAVLLFAAVLYVLN